MKYALFALLAMLVVPAVSEAKSRVSVGIGVGWSSGGSYVSGSYYSGGYYGGGCAPAPVYYAPRVVYRPAPVYYAPAPVYYSPAPVYYAPAPRPYYYSGYRYCR